MEELIKHKYVNLRFQVVVDSVGYTELYKLGSIPKIIYDDEKGIDIDIDFKKHISPVYEVIK